MKILHTSDWHLGAMDGERSLLEDQKYFIDKICDIVIQNKIDAVLISGDIYDRALASAEAVKLYDYAMTRLCAEIKTSVILIAGNHDSSERLSSCSNLLSAAGLYICGSLDLSHCVVRFDDTDIYMLPWITEQKVKSLLPDEKQNIDNLEDAYRIVISKMQNAFNPEKKHVLLAHAFITNSETSTSDRAAEIGSATQIPANIFDDFDYVALGHIHKPQNITKLIRYSGTPMPYSFGKEEKQEKSVTIIDTKTMSQTIVPLPLLHLRNTLSETLQELMDPHFGDKIINGYVRLQVADSYVGLQTLSDLRRIYPNLLEVTGKTFESENTSVTMTMEDLEKFEENPVEVFKYFCKEETDELPDQHLISLFENAIKTVEEAKS